MHARICGKWWTILDFLGTSFCIILYTLMNIVLCEWTNHYICHDYTSCSVVANWYFFGGKSRSFFFIRHEKYLLILTTDILRPEWNRLHLRLRGSTAFTMYITDDLYCVYWRQYHSTISADLYDVLYNVLLVLDWPGIVRFSPVIVSCVVSAHFVVVHVSMHRVTVQYRLITFVAPHCPIGVPPSGRLGSLL